MNLEPNRSILWRVLREAPQLDIFDLAYEFSSETLNSLEVGQYWERKSGLSRKGIIARIAIFFWHFWCSLLTAASRANGKMPKSGIVFFAVSKNEIDSVRPIVSQGPNSYLVGKGETVFKFPFASAHLISLPFLPIVLIRFLRSSGYHRKSFAYVLDHYWLLYGLYIVASLWLRQKQATALVVANHMYPFHRVLLRAAREQAIPTFFMQHASLPPNVPFPPADYVLLEGSEALSKLAPPVDSSAQVFLIGMPKHDAYSRRLNSNANVRAIGFCTNNPDPFDRAEELIRTIKQECVTLKLILRPHNSDPRFDEWKQMAKRNAIDFSDSTTELSFDFLRRVDATIAGDSNILLESALMNVYPLYYDFNRTQLDWYGFQRNNLVDYLSEPEQVCRLLATLSREKPDVRLKTSTYCATVGTAFDGSSSQIAQELIESVAFGGEINLTAWRRIASQRAKVYGLQLGVITGHKNRNARLQFEALT
jgi:hypothetical protein